MAVPGSLERLMKLLQTCGYLQHSLRNGSKCYANGPAGTLLRNNIMRSWWDRMVTKSEATFPVSGKITDPMHMFPEVSELMGGSLPISILHTPSQTPSTEHSTQLSQLTNPEMETGLRLIHVCAESSARQTFDQVVNTRISWWKKLSCNAADFTQMDASTGNGLPQLNIQYQFPWGWETIETVQNVGDIPLLEMDNQTSGSSKYHNGSDEVYPQCIDCSTTVDMAMVVFLNDGYSERQCLEDTSITRQILQLHPTLAPFKVALTRDGSKHRQIHEVATYIGRELRKAGVQVLDTRDTRSTLNTQVVRYDELGVPFTVIVNDATIDTGAIALRSRDTTISETLAINKLVHYVTKHVTYQP